MCYATGRSGRTGGRWIDFNLLPDRPRPVGRALESVGTDAWGAIAEELRVRLEESTYRAWFSRVFPLGLEGDVFVVAVPNLFFSQWLRRRYSALVADVAGGVLGRAVAVEWRVAPMLFQESRRRAPSTIAGASEAAPCLSEFLDGIGWDARDEGEEELLYAHGDSLLLEAARQFRLAERRGARILRPSAYYVGIVRRLARERVGSTVPRVQSRRGWEEL